MPHFILEYTDNLPDHADVPGVLAKVNAALIAEGGVFPIGGIRARAIRLTEYAVADGSGDYGFAHATLKIGAGRDQATRDRVCGRLFEILKSHFARTAEEMGFALSLELIEFSEGGVLKHNNLHKRLAARDQ
jgi:5-carboxymethyl-2-hydroxymuconate isomerase